MSIERPEQSQDTWTALADQLSELPDVQSGIVPRAVNTIINLLRKGNVDSARATFKWEADKIIQFQEVYDLLSEEFREQK